MLRIQFDPSPEYTRQLVKLMAEKVSAATQQILDAVADTKKVLGDKATAENQQVLAAIDAIKAQIPPDGATDINTTAILAALDDLKGTTVTAIENVYNTPVEPSEVAPVEGSVEPTV